VDACGDLRGRGYLHDDRWRGEVWVDHTSQNPLSSRPLEPGARGGRSADKRQDTRKLAGTSGKVNLPLRVVQTSATGNLSTRSVTMAFGTA